VYFASTFYIEPLTKLRVTLDLPKGDDPEGPRESVACEGVVVRTLPEAYDPSVSEYQVACYFTGVSSPEKLESYILRHVPI
jgi:hypothetical protein